MAKFRMKKPKQSAMVGVLAGVVLVGGTATGMLFLNHRTLENTKSQYEAALQAKDRDLQRYQLSSVKGYVLLKDLEAGSTIKAEDVNLVDLPDFFTPTNVISSQEDIVGKVIKINSATNTAVTKEMVYDDGPIDPSERKVELDYVKLPMKLKETDFLDVRIVFPNGEDYRILNKKKMTSFDLANQYLFLDMNIEEIHLMESALVDAYANKAEIYALQYVEPAMQDEPIATYYPNADVLKVIQADPGITNKARYQMGATIRQSLDARLAAIKDENKIRVGAELPQGSAVDKRKQTVGAAVTVDPSNPATPADDANKQPDVPEGFVPDNTTTPDAEEGVGGE